MDTPSPSPTIDIPEVSIHFGHYLWPLGLAVVCLVVCGACIYAIISERDSSDSGLIIGCGVGALATAVIGLWQFATFYSRARTAARAVGGLGSLFLLVVLVAFGMWAYEHDR